MPMSRPGGRAAPETNSDRLRALGEVAAELMHDLANLVAVVKGRAAVALGDAQTGRIPLAELERLSETSDELGSMLRDVMETLKGKGLSPEVVFDPKYVAERVIRRFLDGAPPLEIRLITTLPPGTAVRGRASFFSRALANLLSNGARYARREIRLTLVVVREDGDEFLVASVEDDGPGVADEEIGSIFQPLTRDERSGGTGLGLSSVVWAVTQLRGSVRYQQSEQLNGACFELRLPVLRERDPIRPPERDLLAGFRLLVLDDDSVVREALVRLFGRVGADASAIDPDETSGDQLLDMILRAMPDAILLDLKLGMQGGTDIWSALNASVPVLARRVVFLSGLGPGDREWDAARHSGQPLLHKPVNLEELARAVHAIAD